MGSDQDDLTINKRIITRIVAFGDLYRINTNLSNLLVREAINSTNRDLNTSLRKLSTGLRVGKPEDDAASYSIGAKVNARIFGLVQALQNTSDAKSVLDITEANLRNIADQLTQIKKLVIQASNGVYSNLERQFIRNSINGYATEIQSIVSATEYNNINLLDGSYSANYQVGEGDSDTLQFDIDADFSIEDIQTFEVSSEGVFSSSGAITLATQLNDLDQFSGLQAGDSFDIVLTANDGTVTTTTMNLGGSKGSLATETIADVINAINGTGTFSATLDAQGNIDVTETVVTVGNQFELRFDNFVEAPSTDGASASVPISFNATTGNLETAFTGGAFTAGTNLNAIDQFSDLEGGDFLRLRLRTRTGTSSFVDITMAGAIGAATTSTLGSIRDAINAQTAGAFTASVSGGQLVIQENNLARASFNTAMSFVEGSGGDATVPAPLTNFSYVGENLVSSAFIDSGTLLAADQNTAINSLVGFTNIDDDDTINITLTTRSGASTVVGFSLNDGLIDGTSTRTLGDLRDAINATAGTVFTASISGAGELIIVEDVPAQQNLNLTVQTFTENNIDITPKGFSNVTFNISEFLEVADDTGLVVGLGLVDFGSGTNLTQSISNKLIDNVEASLDRVFQTLNQIGVAQVQLSNREVFLAKSINNNNAVLSRIRDSDFAKETSNFLKLSIQQRFQIIAASQANLQPASLLDLL